QYSRASRATNARRVGGPLRRTPGQLSATASALGTPGGPAPHRTATGGAPVGIAGRDVPPQVSRRGAVLIYSQTVRVPGRFVTGGRRLLVTRIQPGRQHLQGCTHLPANRLRVHAA